MEKVKVLICTGTACFVMGGSEILLIEDQLPDDLKGKVEVEGITCLENCKNASCGKAPFVLVNGDVVSQATITSVIEKIRTVLHA